VAECLDYGQGPTICRILGSENGRLPMQVLLLRAARIVAAALGAWVGYVAGFAVSYYTGDRGDVGAAFDTVVWVPVGILVCSIAAYRVANIALRRFE